MASKLRIFNISMTGALSRASGLIIFKHPDVWASEPTSESLFLARSDAHSGAQKDQPPRG